MELIFVIVNYPMRLELVILSPLVYYKNKIDSFCRVKCNFEILFL